MSSDDDKLVLITPFLSEDGDTVPAFVIESIFIPFSVSLEVVGFPNFIPFFESLENGDDRRAEIVAAVDDLGDPNFF